MITTDFILVCDYAFLTSENKLSMIGVFNKITTTAFPARHARFSFVARLSDNEITQPAEHRIRLRISRNGEDVVADDSPERTITINPGKKFDYVVNLAGFVFPEAATYRLEVLIDGTQINSFTELEVSHA